MLAIIHFKVYDHQSSLKKKTQVQYTQTNNLSSVFIGMKTLDKLLVCIY
jgi:hypothetical protein